MSLFREESENASATAQRWWQTRRARITAAVVGALLLLFLIWRACRGPSADQGEANVVVSVQVAKAEVGPIANEISAVATLTAAREATITPKISAQITRMDLLTNRTVHAGDVLAVLESRDLQAQLAEANAALQEAQASASTTSEGNVPLTNAQDQKNVTDARAALENAKKTYERRQTLFSQGGISEKDLEASKLAVTNAENDLRLAEASLNLHRGITNPGDIRVAQSKERQARDRLANLTAQMSYAVVRAPFSGVVTGQFQYQGDLANPSAKILTIADTSRLIAKMQLAEPIASMLKIGDRVKILPDEPSGQAFAGTISLVGRAVDPVSRSVEVWVDVANPTGQLRPNGVARVVIAAQPVQNAVTVPSSAVTLDATNGNSGTVIVVDAQSVAHEVHVTVGIKGSTRTQITSGLRGGETVVTEGNYGLPDGTKVSVATPGQSG